MKTYAVIVAAGTGSRMKSEVPKQFMLLNNKPVLFYSVQRFLQAYDDLEVILVLPADHMANGQEIVDGFFDSKRITICEGGRTRFHSVKNGLSLIESESIIFVHDGVRCLVTTGLIDRCFKAAVEFGTAVPVVDMKESVRLITEDGNEPVERDSVKIVQTPQAYHSKILLPAFTIDYKEKFTDEASVVEAYGLKIHLVKGEENNIKITLPSDLLFAETLLSEP
ncbi:MAG: 2-C-methyl-D-erythritol 4-phosphate cytidylyltransferase [Ginsengibacter sp.]